jgi:hypothetical protein
MEKVSNIHRRFFAAVIVGGLAVSSICLGYSGGSGTAENPYQIATAEDLNDIGNNPEDWDKHFILMNNVDLAQYTGTKFKIIGNGTTNFTGIFDGNGHKIFNFTWSSGSESFIGLFGQVGSSGQIKNLGLENVNVNVSMSDLSFYIGGLAGYNSGMITNCYSSGGVSGRQYVGVLTGGNSNVGKITDCYASGSVWGKNGVGGMAGYNFGTINSCYCSVSVFEDGWYGNSGGLVGNNETWPNPIYKATITNSYSTGMVSGTSNVGGLVGWNSNATITNCYSKGSVSGSSSVGGLVGSGDPNSVNNSFWDKDTSGQTKSAGGTPKTTVEMKTGSTFIDTNWDFVGETANGTEDIWRMCVDGLNYPLLWWQFNIADFACPDGVEMNDLAELCEEWLCEELSADVWPEGGDGIVNFFDWAVFANQWQITADYQTIADFAGQWLRTGARYYITDIAPAGGGDGIVNMADFAVFANNWLEGL